MPGPGHLGGHRILDASIPSNKLTTAAQTEVLDRVCLIFPLKKKTIAAPSAGTPTQFTVADPTGVSATTTAAGIVYSGNETIKEYANVGLLTPEGDNIIGPNGRTVWGRVTLYSYNGGTGQTTYTITVYDDADQTNASPVAITWNQGTMGATIGIVELPQRKPLSQLGQLDLRSHFVGLAPTERDNETLDDILQLYAKTGVPEGSSIVYTYKRFVSDGDSLKVAIDKLDNQLYSTNQTLTSEQTTRASADTALQNELDATQTGAGLNANGTYTAPTAGMTYIGTSTSIVDATKKLDAATKGVADRATSLETYQSTTGTLVDKETPTGSVGAGNLTFTLAHAPKAGTTLVMVGSVVLLEGTHYTISSSTLSYVSGYEPQAGEWHRVSYRY